MSRLSQKRTFLLTFAGVAGRNINTSASSWDSLPAKLQAEAFSDVVQEDCNDGKLHME